MDYIEANAQPIQIPLGDFLDMRDELIELRKLKEEKEQQEEIPSEDKSLTVSIEFLKANNLNGFKPDEPLIGDVVKKLIDEAEEKARNNPRAISIKYYWNPYSDNRFHGSMMNTIIEIEKFLTANQISADIVRAVGRTTHLCNMYCSFLLMAEPGDWIEIRDHRPTDKANTSFPSEDLSRSIFQRLRLEKSHVELVEVRDQGIIKIRRVENQK